MKKKLLAITFAGALGVSTLNAQQPPPPQQQQLDMQKVLKTAMEALQVIQTYSNVSALQAKGHQALDALMIALQRTAKRDAAGKLIGSVADPTISKLDRIKAMREFSTLFDEIIGTPIKLLKHIGDIIKALDKTGKIGPVISEITMTVNAAPKLMRMQSKFLPFEGGPAYAIIDGKLITISAEQVRQVLAGGGAGAAPVAIPDDLFAGF